LLGIGYAGADFIEGFIKKNASEFAAAKEILECIPALTGPPEKAWHVLYGTPTDNALFGFDANDAALGVAYYSMCS
jgi:hypothetical protein